MKKMYLVILMLALFFIAAGCSEQKRSPDEESLRGNVVDSTAFQNSIEAVAEIKPLKDANVQGTVTFSKVSGSQVRVVADITGLTPGKHGFHIHQNGDCNSPDGQSAGGHFNPSGKKHGGPADEERHDGDLGNLDADENGNARLEWTDNTLSFDGERSIIGKAVLIHAKVDDLKSDPAGNSGDRIACGVIKQKE